MLRILFIDGRLTEQASREVYDRQRPSQTAATLSPAICHAKNLSQLLVRSDLLRHYGLGLGAGVNLGVAVGVGVPHGCSW
jgi:hypothetical protein